MGLIWTKLTQSFGKKPARIMMLGLDAAGKTTILYQLQGTPQSGTVPTVGFNVESIKLNDVALNVWDIGGQHRVRPLWRHYIGGTNGLVWVVDSKDHSRLPEAADELQGILEDQNVGADVPVLVLANKQDLEGALHPEEICQRLGLDRYTGRMWYVHPTCATTGDGLTEGMEWLVANLTAKSKQKR